MLRHRLSLWSSVAGVLVLLLSACGQAAAPTATATKAPVPTAANTATPTTSATPSAQSTAVPGALLSAETYPADIAKKYIAEGFSLPGMGRGLDEEPQYGGQVTIANRGDLPSDDPMLTGTSTFQQAMSPVLGSGGFLRPKPQNNYEAEGYLAESWEVSSDYMTWTFKLRPNLKWHDGAAVTAEDVKFWIDLAVTPPKGRKTAGYYLSFGKLKEVQVVDPTTVRLVLKEAAPFLAEEMYTNASVLSHPKRLVQPLIDQGKTEIGMNSYGWVATGPFKVDRYDKGASIRHVKFDQYWEKDAKGRSTPYLDAIYYPFIPDATVMVSAFRAGRIDATARGTGYNLTPDMVANIKKTLGDKAWFMRYPYVSWSANLNSTKPPFNDVRVRKALSLHTDRQQAIQLVYGGYAVEGGIMAPGSDWADPSIREWPGYNPKTKAADQAEAKRLLTEAGAVGTPVTLTCRDIWLAVCEYLNLSVKELGMKPTVEIMDFNVMTEKNQSGNYQAITRSGGAAHPGQLLTPYLTANPLVAVKTGDPRIDEMDSAIKTTIDPAARRKLVRGAVEYVVLDKAYETYWFFEEAVNAYRTYMKGVYTPNRTVQNNNSWGTLWVDKKLR